MQPIPIFIGYDPKETIAYHVCTNSIIRHASRPISIIPVALTLLSDYTETHIDGSNQFSYSRFLVPHLMNFTGHAIFMDGDMVVQDDISNLWDLRDSSKDVQVVKHQYKTKMSVKYCGTKNENYPKKNWSSVVLWNCAASNCQKLTPSYIQSATGPHLHQFKWTTDELVGELPIEWNWLPDELGLNLSAKILHYTLGTPCFQEFSNTTMADVWHQEREYTEYCQQRTI